MAKQPTTVTPLPLAEVQRPPAVVAWGMAHHQPLVRSAGAGPDIVHAKYAPLPAQGGRHPELRRIAERMLR